MSYRQSNKEIWLVFGTGSENHEQLLTQAFKRSHKVALVQSPHYKAIPRSVLVDYVNASLSSESSKLIDNQADPAIGPTLSLILDKIKPPVATSVIVLTGSLFVAAEARVVCDTQGYFNFPAHDWVKQREPVIGGYK